MSVPNFSSIAGLEVPKKFVMGGGWNTWLLCLTPTLVALELFWVELSYVGFLQLVHTILLLDQHFFLTNILGRDTFETSNSRFFGGVGAQKRNIHAPANLFSLTL